MINHLDWLEAQHLRERLEDQAYALRLLIDSWQKRMKEHITIRISDDPIKRINENIKRDWEALR